MLAHFQLQRTLLERQLRALRLAPWLVYALAPVLFSAGSWLLLQRSEHLAWLLVFSGLSLVRPFSGAARSDFFRGLYRAGTFRKIRLLENGLVLLPFLLVLLVIAVLLRSVSCGAGALVLGGVGLAMVWWTDRPRSGRALPTPFSARPFEFAVGFRRYRIILLIVLFLLVQAVWVANFSLGGFALAVLLLLGCHLAQEPEPHFYVWIYTMSPKVFLRRKLSLLLTQQLLLSLPVIVALLVVFPENWLAVGGITVIGLGNLALSLLLKYSNFPHQLHIGHAIMLSLGLFLAPTLVILLPLYYQRALSRLAIHLPDA